MSVRYCLCIDLQFQSPLTILRRIVIVVESALISQSVRIELEIASELFDVSLNESKELSEQCLGFLYCQHALI